MTAHKVLFIIIICYVPKKRDAFLGHPSYNLCENTKHNYQRYSTRTLRTNIVTRISSWMKSKRRR
jgi:hypothetical protein